MINQPSGPALLLGHNIDTDQIYPGRYLELTDKKQIAEHCLEGVKEGLNREHISDSILVAGRNFGCGSSREHAVITLKEAGVRLIIASSFARIFFRNAINLGLPVLTMKDTEPVAVDRDRLEADLSKGTVFNRTQNKTFQGELLPAFILDILYDGGIINRLKKAATT